MKAYTLFGTTLSKLGKYQEAIELNPANTNAYTNWGNALSRLEQYPEAIKKFQQAVALDKTLANTVLFYIASETKEIKEAFGELY